MSSRQLLPSSCRGLHSPSLLAFSGASNYPASHVVSLSGLNIVAGTSTVLDSGWAAMHYELKLPVGILTIFQRPLTVPLHSPDGRQLPAIRAVQGDCETVYFSCMNNLISCPMEFSCQYLPADPSIIYSTLNTQHGSRDKKHLSKKQNGQYVFFFLQNWLL